MTGSIDRQVEAQLRADGVRFTERRRAVLRALVRAEGPRSAAELHTDLDRGIPLSSLYRSLAVLEAAGVVVPHHGTRGLTRYEPAEWLSGHHHHVVCAACGAVEDVELPPELEGELQAVVTRAVGGSGFSVRGHSLEIDGRCRRCA